jgi:hypothetical protein
VTEFLHVEMVFDPACPNLGRARTAIRTALAAVGAPVVWREWPRGDPATPPRLRALGSPSVLVNGRDVGCNTGSPANADANSCRIYIDERGCICGAPTPELILRAIAATREGREIA